MNYSLLNKKPDIERMDIGDYIPIRSFFAAIYKAISVSVS